MSQGAVFVGSEHGVEVSNTYSMIRSDCAVGQFYQNAITWRASVSANDNGFAVTPNASASSDVAYYLAIELPDPEDAYVGIVDAYTGAGFTPQALILAQTVATALDTSTNHGFLALGAGGPVTTERCLDYTDEDGQTETDSESEADLSNILHIKTGDAADDAIAALDSFDSDGWTLNYSDGSASARKILAIALGASTGGAVTVEGTAATIAFTGGTAVIAQAQSVAASAATIAWTAGSATIRQDQRVVASAATIAWTAGIATIRQDQRVVASAGTWQFVAGSASVELGGGAITVPANAATIAFTGGTAVVSQAATVTGTAATIAFVGGTASIRQDSIIAANAASITFTAGSAVVQQPSVVEGTAAVWTLEGGTATISQGNELGGRLVRSRRTRSRHWEDTELDRLLDALGRSPVERDKKSLQAEARVGLTALITSGQPMAVSYDGSDMLLDLVGQQIRLGGQLKRHVEQLMDDEDVADVLHLIL